MRTRAAELQHGAAHRQPFLKLRWLVLVGFALLLVVLSAALQPLVRWQTRKLLDGLEGAGADFSDAHLTIFPLRYRITHLKIRDRPPKTKEPVFYADELAIRLRWDRLLTGKLVGTVEGRQAKVVLHQPGEGSQSRLPPIEQLVPFRAELERAQASQGEVLYIWVREQHQPSVWFHHIEATLENVGSRPGITEGPMVLSARGKVQRSGTMTVSIKADPYATPLSFAGKATLSGFDPSEINAFLVTQKGVKLTPGRFDLEMSFECRQGCLRGWISPRLTGTKISAADGDVGSALRALFGKVSMTFASPTEGTQPSGRIAIAEDLTDPKRQLWPTMEKVVEDGLVIGLEEAVKRTFGDKRVDEPARKPTKLEIKP